MEGRKQKHKTKTYIFDGKECDIELHHYTYEDIFFISNQPDLATIEGMPGYPDDVKLIISNCKSLKSLLGSYQGLEYLRIEKCESIEEISNLPEGLKILSISNCKSLKNLPNLPQSLESLTVVNLDCIEDLSNLPEGLKVMKVSSSDNLTRVDLPKNLEVLEIDDCALLQDIQNIEALPSNLQKLEIIDNKALQGRLVIPKTLSNLNIKGCDNLKVAMCEYPEGDSKLKYMIVSESNLENFVNFSELKSLEYIVIEGSSQPGIKNLDLSGTKVWKGKFDECQSLESVSGLSDLYCDFDNTHLDFSKCDNLKKITELGCLPDSNTELDIYDCESLVEISGSGLGVVSISVDKCTSLESIGLSELGERFRRLEIKGCPIKNLPPTPPELESLEISHCHEFEEYLELPTCKVTCFNSCSNVKYLALEEGCKRLEIAKCSDAESLILPESIERVVMKDCPAVAIQDLNRPLLSHVDIDLNCRRMITDDFIIQGLVRLYRDGCRIMPYEFRESIIAISAENSESHSDLQKIIDLSKPIQNPYPSDILELLRRFITQGLATRGKGRAQELLSPVLSFIEENPQSLRWMNEIAQLYLDGCINQPVAGFAEIACWVQILQQKTFDAKIEMTKRLMVQNSVKEAIKKSLPGAAVEVEAFNVTLRDLQQCHEIPQDWIGISKNICYEGCVANWYQEFKKSQNFKELISQKNDILKIPHEEIEEYLCTSQLKIWSQMILPLQEVQKITEFFLAKSESLMNAAGSFSANELVERIQEIQLKQESLLSKVCLCVIEMEKRFDLEPEKGTEEVMEQRKEAIKEIVNQALQKPKRKLPKLPALRQRRRLPEIPEASINPTDSSPTDENQQQGKLP